MTNFEKYKDKILEIVNEGCNFTIKNNKIENCENAYCKECVFHKEALSCSASKIRWLYKEASRWTDDEIELAKALKNLGVNYIERDCGFEFRFTGVGVLFAINIEGLKGFQSIKKGECISVDDIIKEGDN